MIGRLNGFNRIAAIYDRLSALVFGKSITDAQILYLGHIPQGAKVLIIGGGTGKVLEALFSINPGCRVWYVEASSAMIGRARKRAGEKLSQVRFIHGTEQSVPGDIRCDAVIMNFFLDLFPPALLPQIIARTTASLKRNGILLVTDFADNGKWWQGVMLAVMYRFFRITTGIEASRLPEWEDIIRAMSFQAHEARYFFKDFIKAVSFRKKISG